MLFHDTTKFNEIHLPKPIIVDLILLTVSCSRAEHFIRNDLVRPSFVFDDHQKVAPSWKFMSSKADRMYVINSVYSMRYSLSDPESLADKTRSVVTLLAKTLASCKIITWLFCTVWSATADLDYSLSDWLPKFEGKKILFRKTFPTKVGKHECTHIAEIEFDNIFCLFLWKIAVKTFLSHHLTMVIYTIYNKHENMKINSLADFFT